MSTNPFRKHSTIDEENYLKIRFELLKSNKQPAAFNHALVMLVEVRRILRIIYGAGRLSELGGRIYYLQALQWLHGEIPLTTYINVPQISDGSEPIDEGTANLFDQFVTIMQNNLHTESLYGQVELISAINRASTTQKVDLRAEELLDEFQTQADNVVSDNTDALNQRFNEITQQFGDQRRDSFDQITNQLNNALSQFRQARALEEWGQSYEEDIADYERRLYGRHWAANTMNRNWRSFVEKVRASNERKDRLRWKLWRFIFLVLKNVFGIFMVVGSKLLSYRGQRNIWFTLLFFLVLFFTGMSFESATGHSKVFGISLPSVGIIGEPEWYLKLTLYVPLAILLGMAYSFAVKNFRIYSNMLDQYRHRRTVAKTSQGIILSLNSEADAAIRTQMTTAAAAALFEMRNTGHLTKKEVESLGFFDIFSKIIK